MSADNDVTPQQSRSPGTQATRSHRRLLLGTAAGVVLLAVVYLIAAFATAGRLPRAATVAGVDVGGRSPAAARTLTGAAFAERLDAPIRLTAGSAGIDTTLAKAGVGYDADATLGRSGRLLDPARIVHVIVGDDDMEPRFTIDRGVLAATLAPLATEAAVSPVDGAVAFVEGKVVTKRAVVGHRLDTVGSASTLLDAATTSAARNDRAVELPTVDQQPVVTQAAVDEAVKTFAAPAVSGPVQVKVGPRSFRAQPSVFARALSMRATGAALRPVVDATALRSALAGQLAEVETKPTSAKIVIRDDKPVIVGGNDGAKAPSAELAAALMTALTKSGAARVATVKVVTTPSANGPAALAKLGVTEKVSTFTTKFPYAAYRNQNIGRAASLVNGTLLAPGDTFSLNGIVGERTVANGFTSGFVIQGGRLRKDLGGGVSQLATTLYNAAFFAGLDDVEHRAHAFYINRYPLGREATVYWGSIDLRFKNNTPHGVYVQSHLAKGAPGRKGVLTVTMWSTKYWAVTTTTSDRHGYRAPSRIVDPGSRCEPQAGTPGFDVDITRKISRNGKLVKTETYTTKYAAEDSIRCTG